MTWLQGGPYYEISFLLKNSEDKGKLLRSIISKINSQLAIELNHSIKELASRVLAFEQGEKDGLIIRRNIELDAITQISGTRKHRLFISELSEELIKLNFWFYGSLYDAKEWNQKGIRSIDKPAFIQFFKSAKVVLEPILGTIAYEEDCEELFMTDILSPNKYFSIKNLNINSIKERLNQNVNQYEYFWLGKGGIGNETKIEIQIKP